MGRKYKNLYPEMCTFENLWIASRMARKGKRRRPDVLEFEYNLENNLLDIRQELQDKTYQFSPYHTFKIKEPKERFICAAPYKDRVVHHALCNVMAPILDRAMIFDTYACRPLKGAHRAVIRAQHFLRSASWVLKLDIKKYFFTIDHQILIRDLEKKIKDRCFIQFIENLLHTYKSHPNYYYLFNGDDLFDMIRERGLPIGNLTSQWFANWYLNPVDRAVKENLNIKRYLRYMDDLLIFGDTKSELQEIKKNVRTLLAERRLLLHEKKSQIKPVSHGVRFLGFQLKPSHKKILRPNLKRFKKRMKQRAIQYGNGDIDFDTCLQSLNGWLGYAGREHAYFINEILESIGFYYPDERQIKFNFFVPSGQVEKNEPCASRR